jgi:expansin (peptidoglycan-binding protein)
MRTTTLFRHLLLAALGCSDPASPSEARVEPGGANSGIGSSQDPGPNAGAAGCGSGPCAAAGAVGSAGAAAAGAGASGAGASGAGGAAPQSGASGNGNAGSGGGTVDPDSSSCLGELGDYQSGSVTYYYLDQGTTVVHCSYAELGRNPDVIAHVATGGGQYFGAINTADYAASATCGACVEVTRDGSKSVTVTIVDECPIATNPKCTPGHIDLSREAFKQIGAESEGYLGTGNGGLVGQISWKYVPCPAGSNVFFKLKEPSNGNWNAVLVVGHRYPITKVQVNVDGNWIDAARQDYNYWLPPNGHMGTSPYQIRVTDVNGAVLEGAVALSGADQDSGQQFSCE